MFQQTIEYFLKVSFFIWVFPICGIALYGVGLEIGFIPYMVLSVIATAFCQSIDSTFGSNLAPKGGGLKHMFVGFLPTVVVWEIAALLLAFFIAKWKMIDLENRKLMSRK